MDDNTGAVGPYCALHQWHSIHMLTPRKLRLFHCTTQLFCDFTPKWLYEDVNFVSLSLFHGGLEKTILGLFHNEIDITNKDID